MTNKERKTLWKPGQTPYPEFLKSLTPAEREAHLQQRKLKKSMKNAFEKIIQAQQEEWLAKLNSAFIAVLDRAVQTGDPAALAAVFDRMVGKPETAVDITSKGKSLQAPTIVFQPAVSDEWKDDKE
jgi:hypothetical protein